MFEKEIQTAKHRLSLQLLTDKTYVYLQDVLTHPDVHDFYKQFFRSEVEWWIYEQQMLREANPRFHYDDEAFTVVLRSYDDECKRTARFEHGELVSLIDLAVKTRVNYLLRPRTTLKWFVYRGEPTKSLREVLLRCAYFNCYNYLTDEFSKWAAAKGLESAQQDILSVIEFERLIEHIDNEIILEHTTSEFTELLAPLYDFFGELESEQSDGAIPTPALIIFLDDKGILRISQELERLMKEDGLHSITRSEFLRVIDSVISQVEEETGTQDYVQDTTIPLDFEHTVRQRQELSNPTGDVVGENGGSGVHSDATEEVAEDRNAENSLGAFTDEVRISTPDEGGASDEGPLLSGDDELVTDQPEDDLHDGIPLVVELEEEVHEESEEVAVEESGEDTPYTEGEVSGIAVIQEAEVLSLADDETGEKNQEEFDIAVHGADEPLEIETDEVVEDVSIVEDIETDVAENEPIPVDYSTLQSNEDEPVLDSADEDEAEVIQLVEEHPIVVDILADEQEAQSAEVEKVDTLPAAEVEAVAEEIHEGEAIVVEDYLENSTSDDEPIDSISAIEIEDIVEEVLAEQTGATEESAEDIGLLDEELQSDGMMESAPAMDIEDIAPEILDEQVGMMGESAEGLEVVDDELRIDELMENASAVEIETASIESSEGQVEEEVAEDMELLDGNLRVADMMANTSAIELEDVVPEISIEQMGTVEEHDEDGELLADKPLAEAVDKLSSTREYQEVNGEYQEEQENVLEEEMAEADNDNAIGADAPTAAEIAEDDETDAGIAALFAENEHGVQEQGEEDSDAVEDYDQEEHRALHPPVQALIDENLQQRVLKHIFHHDEAQYRAILNQVNATESWRDASVLIDRVFMENEVDPYSSIAKKFSDVVYERFL